MAKKRVALTDAQKAVVAKLRKIEHAAINIRERIQIDGMSPRDAIQAIQRAADITNEDISRYV